MHVDDYRNSFIPYKYKLNVFNVRDGTRCTYVMLTTCIHEGDTTCTMTIYQYLYGCYDAMMIQNIFTIFKLILVYMHT